MSWNRPTPLASPGLGAVLVTGGDSVMGTRSRRLRSAALATAVIGVSLGVIAVALKVVPAHGHGGDLSFIPVAIPILALAGVGLMLSLRLPSNPVGWLVSASQISFTLLLLGANYSDRLTVAKDVPSWPLDPIVFLTTFGWSAGFPFLLILLPLVFPDGRLVSRRWRVAVWLAVATITFTIASTITAGLFSGPGQDPTTVTGPALVFGIMSGPISGVFMVALMVAAIVSLVIRYRRAGSELRHQLKWFLAAIAVAVLAVIPELAGVNSGFGGFALVIGLTVVPVGIAIAVLRYRLYDIDVIINRALVYGALAAMITVIYVGIVVGVGSFIGSGARPNLALSIVATAVVAVGFQPVRERLQRIANRLVYGKRATPYEVLAEFSEKVSESYAGEEVLLRMARVLAEGTAAERAEVWIRTSDRLVAAATWPQGPAEIESLPITGQLLPAFPGARRSVVVRHQGELMGALTVSKRRGETLTPIEEKLFEDLAHQAGLVLKNVGLTAELRGRLEELRASRQRLVAAQDAERRRLERNLHDGAQQNLVALKVKLGLAELMFTKDPGKARELLTSLKGDADDALETLRDLARGIYPPLLADQGLAAALEAHARKSTLPVSVEATLKARYPREVEAAVYFCCLEALQNVQKYAGASTATVRLDELDDEIAFSVLDDGRGFDPATTPTGSGLLNMSDRLDALEGHLTITSEPGRFTRVAGILSVRNAPLPSH